MFYDNTTCDAIPMMLIGRDWDDPQCAALCVRCWLDVWSTWDQSSSADQMDFLLTGVVHIKDPLLLIGKRSLYGSSGFSLSLSEWSYILSHIKVLKGNLK